MHRILEKRGKLVDRALRTLISIVYVGIWNWYFNQVVMTILYTKKAQNKPLLSGNQWDEFNRTMSDLDSAYPEEAWGNLLWCTLTSTFTTAPTGRLDEMWGQQGSCKSAVIGLNSAYALTVSKNVINSLNITDFCFSFFFFFSWLCFFICKLRFITFNTYGCHEDRIQPYKALPIVHANSLKVLIRNIREKFNLNVTALSLFQLHNFK